MADTKFKVGIIGAGMITKAAHIPAWRNLKKDLEITCIADVSEERARHVAQAHGIACWYGDWRKMLAEEKPDIVSVCTPNAYHKEQVIAALKAGAHVLCEKPVATSYADAEEMFDVAERAKRILFVGQSSRFTNAALAAKEIIDAGRLGEVYYAETYYLRRRGIPTWGQFHVKQHSGGGPIFDLGVHSIDLLFWLMGSPKVVAVSGATYTKLAHREEGTLVLPGTQHAHGYRARDFDVEDMAAGFIRLEGGATVSFKTSWAANVPQNTSNTMLLGTEGGLVLDPLTLITSLGSLQADVRPHVPPDRAVEFFGHWTQAEHFLRVLQGQEKLIITRDQVLMVMKTLDALYESSVKGREVVLQ